MHLFLQVFWRAMHTEKAVLTKKAITSLLLAVIWIIEPLYARYAVDTMVSAIDGGTVNFVQIIGQWFGLYVIASVVSGVSMRYVWDVRNAVVARTREMYYARLLHLDLEHHIKSKTGELMKKIDNASDTLADLTQQLLIQIPTSSLTAIAFFCVSLYISWQLTLLAFLMIPVFLVIIYLGNLMTRKHVVKVNNLWVNALGRGYDVVANIVTVKSSGTEADEINALRRKHTEGIKELDKVNQVWALIEGIGFFELLRIVLASAGLYLYSQGQMSLGSVFFYQFGFFRMVVPFQMLATMSPKWNEMINKIELAEAMYATPITINNIDNPITLTPLKGKIELIHASLAYDTTDALQDVSFTINPGEHVALVGHSGAGKSTLAMLLNRFYDVTAGQILIDDTNIMNLDIQWWRQQIGLVQQENIMFNDTVLENIRYSRSNALQEEVEAAAKRASAHEFITKLPNGYNTSIGERGIRLSGGERQRVAIARAILKQPQLVILDEATSALDSITERDVQQGIEALIKGRTAVIIAHRLSTVRKVDKIAVLKDGGLLAYGSHAELMHTCATYKEMVDLQSEGMLMES